MKDKGTDEEVTDEEITDEESQIKHMLNISKNWSGTTRIWAL
jgi:hypothetical protein